MKKILFFVLVIGVIQVAFSRPPESGQRPSNSTHVNYRADCQAGNSSVDLAINNVRARLLSRGDFWWDYNDAKYIVPVPDAASGAVEVASIFAGAVWMGGFDPAGNLKIAATDYANSGKTDFYPGPLDPTTGTTDAETCNKWDRHFEVLGTNITQFRAIWQAAFDSGTTMSESEIPDDVKFYPARGNPYFVLQSNGFQLPDQELGSFYDRNENGVYEPLDGDYPAIDIRGCPLDQYPDQMFFQIYNDNGGPHTITQGVPIRMEVQVQAFGYQTTDELNDMTFMRYKLINRAQDDITDCYFAMWVDADLGCSDDDYIGSDTSRSLAYYYNADDVDGEADCSCEGGVPTYCEKIPMIGIDYFRGPIDENGVELGMSSFTYYNRLSSGTFPPGTGDPSAGNAIGFYNYLTGKWLDGSPFYAGDDGYQDPAFPETKYAFTGLPDDPNSWSMAAEGTGPGDRRTVQASGPFVLEPGTTNELIIGLPWVPNLDYPAPDISKLLAADDKAQNLFDACFDITDGPDAPDVEVIELNNEIVLTLSNNDNVAISNNAKEEYEEDDLGRGNGEKYRFEGYEVYQTVSASVSLADLDDQDVSRLVRQADVKNGVDKLFNWVDAGKNPVDPDQNLYERVEMVSGADNGVKHSFHITSDAFGSGDAPLINHRKYYFVVVAYAQNESEAFDPFIGSGQKNPYLKGRKGSFGRKILPITVIPRPSTYSLVKTKYGQGGVITRLSGSGTGQTFLEISKEQREKILAGTTEGKVTYLPGSGPFVVKVVNPLRVKDGKYRIRVSDGTDPGAEPHSIKDATLNWILEKLDANGGVENTITSERNLDFFNEQILSEYGISIEMGQVNEPGMLADKHAGALGTSMKYDDLSKPLWFGTVRDREGTSLLGFLDSIERHAPKEFAAAVGDNANFYPYGLTNYHPESDNTPYFVSPAWTNPKSKIVRGLNGLYHLNNVDVVLTSDKSKWSRCIITEAASARYGSATASIVEIKPEDNTKQFYLRPKPSVSKDADANGVPLQDDSGTTGMGWFPGYAVDVETGKRLNIFFSENSTYRKDLVDFYPEMDISGFNGADMMFNPSSTAFIFMGTVGPNFDPVVNSFVLGGQHFVYVTYDEYDECAYLREQLSKPQSAKRIKPLSHIQWAGLVMTAQGEEMLSYNDGLIPNDLVLSLRAQNPYNTVTKYTPVSTGVDDIEYGPLPNYEFEFTGIEAAPLASDADKDNALDEIGVVPNPYYGFSQYERDQFTTIVKITNLPAKSTVKIYSLDGKFIRKFERNETPFVDNQTNLSRQISPDVEWDLKNASGIPVASGVYLIHVDAPGLGERVIKWFGMNRQFDPSGL